METKPEYLGIEIGGTKLQMVAGDAEGRVIERKRYTVAKEAGGAGIRKQIEAGLREWRGRNFAGVGVGFGGPVDWRTGRICCSHQIEGWNDFELGEWLRKMTGAQVRVENDANTAALAEAVRGAGRGRNPVFYVTLGSGVGGGLVVEGRIYHGAVPGEAEIGHVRLDREGTIVEERCSGWAVDRKIRKRVEKEAHSELARLVGKEPGGEAKHLSAALAADDALAKEVLNETCAELAFGLSHVVHLVHPEMIVLGGGLSLVGPVLAETVQRYLESCIMEAFVPGPEVRIAELGEDVVPAGALLLAKCD